MGRGQVDGFSDTGGGGGNSQRSREKNNPMLQLHFFSFKGPFSGQI